MNPQFPLYIPSKGRWETRHTSKALCAMKVPHHIVVEKQEVEAYEAAVDPEWVTILELDRRYQDEYDTFDNLGYEKSKGPGPARNFAWDHAMSNGFDWYWVMDDNITHFIRLNRNSKVPAGDGTIFRCMEDFCLRYENVGMAGPNYAMFVPRKSKVPPFVMNTRIYSCNLIRCSVPFRWRGRYNEDTDLSLNLLKAGWCTVQFNAFLQNKLPTQTVKGGNMDEFYAKEGTYEKSKMQVDMHPDVSRLMWRFGRWHHYVDYKPFKSLKLIRRSDIEIPTGTNEYGMTLKRHDNEGGDKQ